MYIRIFIIMNCLYVCLAIRIRLKNNDIFSFCTFIYLTYIFKQFNFVITSNLCI